MSTTTDPVDVVVVGAGLAGLAAARLVQEQGLSVVAVDTAAPGGRASSTVHAGTLVNQGPHAVYLGGPAERILTALGAPLAGGAAGAAWAVDGDRLVPLPTGALSMARSPFLGTRGKLALAKLLAGLQRIDATTLGTTTFAGWMDDTDLPTDARRLVTLLGMVATYVNAPEAVSADVVVAQLQQLLAHGVRYLHQGWQGLVDSLATGVPVRRMGAAALHRDGGWVRVGSDGTGWVTGRTAIVATGGADAAASLLGRRPFEVGPAADVACLDLVTTRPPEPSVLFDLDEPRYLSNHSAGARLAPSGLSMVHVARYLHPGEHPSPAEQRAELEAHAARAGLTADVVAYSRYLHRMPACTAFPTAALGGLRGRPGVDASGVDGVFLAGDWVGPTGHLLDAVLASAESAAHHAARAATLVGR